MQSNDVTLAMGVSIIMRNSIRLIRYLLRLVNLQQPLIFLIIAGIYYVIVVLMFRENPEWLTAPIVSRWTVLVPASVYGIYLGMELIYYERAQHTIELLFALSGSRYRVWVLKMLAMHLAQLLLIVGFTLLDYVLLLRLPIGSVILTVFVSAAFLSELTVLLSLLVRSGNGAGMLMLLLFFLIFQMGTNGSFAQSLFNPMLMPFKPVDVTTGAWLVIVIWNRLTFAGLGIIAAVLSLGYLGQRERFL